MLVIDSSVLVAALVTKGPVGTWAENVLTSEPLAAPHLMPVEVANILRKSVLMGDISRDNASAAHLDLVSLPVELFPYQPFAERVWELRSSLTAYDAWYVSLAEYLEAKLATLDIKLTRSGALKCETMVPPNG